MSTRKVEVAVGDILERRSILEEHRARASRLKAALDSARTADGRSLDDIDPDGVLAESVVAISRLSYTIGTFDLTVMLGPANQWGVHAVGTDSSVEITLVNSEDTHTQAGGDPARPGVTATVAHDLAAALRHA